MIKCVFEDGGQAGLRHVTVTAVVIDNDGNRILLGRRAAHLLEGGKWGLPGGFLDRGETLEQGILREICEETGYRAEIARLLSVVSDPGRGGEDRQNVNFNFLARALEKGGCGDGESSETRWFGLDELPPETEFASDHRGLVGTYVLFRTGRLECPVIK